MAKPQIINTLETKRQQLVDRVDWLEKELRQTQASLSHIAAVMRMYEAPEDGEAFPTIMNLNRLFKRNELPRMAVAALQDAPKGLDTRQLATHVIEVKKLNTTDRHLRTSVAYRLVQVLRRMEKQGRLTRAGKRGNAIIWHTC